MTKLINFERRVTKQQMIVNNVPHEMPKYFMVGSCPDCKAPLISTEFSGTLKEFYDVLAQSDFAIKYCPKCGASLDLPSLLDSEGKPSETK